MSLYHICDLQFSRYSCAPLNSRFLAFLHKTGPEASHQKSPVVWIAGKKLETGYLKHVMAVFDRLGFSRGDPASHWDVLWSHDYPFYQFYDIMLNLRKDQRVNHFPGSGFITNKPNLATFSNQYIPKAFKMPDQKDELLEYAKKNPSKEFVQKSSNHRGIQIKKVGDLNLNARDTFVQEYIDDPFLVDGHKFDIGVYVIITSVNPLRVYTFEEDALFRFCRDEYYPFDSNNVNKYVVRDDYVPIWEIPAIEPYYTSKGFGMKQSFNAYMRSQKHDVDAIWWQIKEAIQTVIMAKEPAIIKEASRYPSFRNFFELMRFDFVLDKNLHVFLMEANLSPNLSSGHFPRNKLLFEQVIFNVLSLVGIARRVHTDSLLPQSDDEESMQVALKDVITFHEDCASSKCQANCSVSECSYCRQCLNVEDIEVLKTAYLEHHSRHGSRRLIPAPMHQDQAFKPLPLKGLLPRNKWMYEWFRGKCLEDATWCL